MVAVVVIAVLAFYGVMSVLAYAFFFRGAWSGDRWVLSRIWPYSLPLTIVLLIRERRRRRLPNARTLRKR